MSEIPVRFGIPLLVERTRTIHPVGNGESYVRYHSIVWVEVEATHYQTHEYVAWCFRDGFGEYGPLRTFDVPFTGMGTRYPRCPDGEVTDPGSSSEEGMSSDGVPVEYEMDEFEPVDMDVDDGEPEPIEEDPVLEAKPEDMVSEEEAAEVESESDSSGSEEEMPDSSSSSESSDSDPDWAP
ncbi:uncharacterized protein LOC130135108 [Syzygium oleosum]|uniref:uncharacterized protein LOC130135108 n=1 Tax=Syzygium oleosum TaxID=219896 RepID=UPI0024BA246F|nr:uncharacterized protein LOC130135108 [Syzygium oleosum]